MVRNRCGVQPHSIDLGVDENGATRKYAHFSCEGAKNVVEALSGGCSLRGSVIQVLPAKIHYTFRLAQAREKREREENDEKEKLDAFWSSVRQRLEKNGNCGEISSNRRKLRSFYYGKQRYGVIASEIASKFRAQHLARFPSSNRNRPCRIASSFSAPPAECSPTTSEGLHPVGEENLHTSTHAVETVMNTAPLQCTSGPNLIRTRFSKKEKGIERKGQTKDKPTASRESQALPGTSNNVGKPAPPPSTEVSKRERKLSGLQGKLALLKLKLNK